MESFGERFLKLRRSAGLTRANMAFLLGISEESVECIETEYMEPNLNVLIRVAQIFNVSEAYVGMFNDDPAVCEDPSVKEIYVLNRFSGDRPIKKSDATGTIFINRNEMHGKDYVAYILKDDSMVRARMCKGDILIVRQQTYASNGDIVVANVDGEEMVRRYTKKGGFICLSPESDGEKHTTVKINPEETNLRLLGVVKEVRIKY